MPRIIPRLLKALENAAYTTEIPPEVPAALIKKKRRSLWTPKTPEANFSVDGRSQSVLLDEVNPIIHKGIFRRHKRLPPRVRINRATLKPSDSSDVPRRMTPQEREWYASPYLRMLASPVRRCFLTDRPLPSDLMIRVSPFQMPEARAARPTQIMLPDGLSNTKFQLRRSGAGYYVYCNRAAFVSLLERGVYRRYSTNVIMSPTILDQISHMLRVRVLQEIELLADRLLCRPRGSQENPVMRKLTRAEFKEFRNTGVLPSKNAVAVLVVPPLNKDPITKQRPEPSNNSMLPVEEEPLRAPKRPSPPVSTLHPAQPADGSMEKYCADLTVELPQYNIPLYNGVPLFPSRSQRAALHTGLNRVLFIERRARYTKPREPSQGSQSISETDSSQDDDTKIDRWARGDQKASHAYLLSSDARTLLRADSADLAIALWRLRMWEGLGPVPPKGESKDFGWKVALPSKRPR